jgi:hypothetical protein
MNNQLTIIQVVAPYTHTHKRHESMKTAKYHLEVRFEVLP